MSLKAWRSPRWARFTRAAGASPAGGMSGVAGDWQGAFTCPPEASLHLRGGYRSALDHFCRHAPPVESKPMTGVREGALLWTPSEEFERQSSMAAYIRWLADHHG